MDILQILHPQKTLFSSIAGSFPWISDNLTKGSRKHTSEVFRIYNLSTDDGTTGRFSQRHPPRLPILRIFCQTSRMRNLTTTICLTLAVLIGSANAQTGSTRDPLILSLFKDGRISLNENLVSLENLVSSLIAIRSSNPEMVSMYFRVDQAATYSQMQIVMKAMKQAGFVLGIAEKGRKGEGFWEVLIGMVLEMEI